MAADVKDAGRATHPSPQRNRVRTWSLATALIAPPLAWSTQLIASFALAAHACYPRSAPIAAPFWPGLNGVLWTISIAAMAIGWASAALAWHNWRATRDEKPGAGHALVDAGEGRTRFLAMCGLIVGCCFALALLWTASGLLLVPACGA
jgi:hypothetical protein